MKHIESEHQKALIQWADISYHRNINGTIGSRLIAIPNGGKRNKIEAARLKKEGVRAGVPDLFFCCKSGEFSGLWIELKKPNGGTLTEKQKEWIEILISEGYQAKVCHGWEHAKNEILGYLNMEYQA